MASGTFYPAVNGDDGNWESTWFGDYDFFAAFGNLGVPYNSFFRFTNVTIPQGAVITNAYIRLYAYSSKSNTVVNLDIFFNAIDDAISPTDVSEAEALLLTSGVAWDGVSAWNGGVQYNSPDIKSALQEVINRAGWNSGNSLLLLIKDDGSTASAYRNVTAYDYSSGAQKAELHIMWDIVGEITDSVGITDAYDLDTPYREITDSIGMADTYASVVLAAIIAEAFGLSDTYDLDTPYREITDGCGIDDTLARSFETFNSITDGVGITDVIAGIFEIFATITNNTGIADAYARFIETNKSIQDDVGSADLHEAIRLFNKLQAETLSTWDTLKWGWHKSIADSMAIAETVSKILGIPVKDWLVLTDTESNNWNGSEAVSDSLYIVDISKVIQIYEDLIADGMAITDAVKLALRLIVTDILTCTDTVLNTGTFQHSIEDGMTLEDVAKRIFPKSISDSFAVTDTSLVDFLALLQISDSFDAADTASRILTINQVIADFLDMLDTVTVQQLIQELIQDGLNIEVSVIIDGEVYECFVLNTSAFHVSVYSGYDYNSYCIDKNNNIVYGCKSDGIYELTGSNDNGVAFHSGIILPASQFGSANNKRFRSAFFGVSGDNVILKMSTDNGWRTYRVTDTEARITRDLKGRSWEVTVEDFDELDFVEIQPIILSKK